MRDLDLDELETKGGTSLKLGDILAMVVRQRWWIAVPLFAIGIAGFGVIRVWPFKYRSEAVVLVQQQKLSEQYVGVNTGNSQDKLDHLSQLILSRARLEQLIRKLNLYPPAQLKNNLDDILVGFRKRIEITPTKDAGQPTQLSGFRISFSAPSAALAQKVTQTLTNSLIDENRRAGTEQSEGTTSFLENQVEAARQELERQEQRQHDLKATYIGELPEQLQANVQMISSLETQLQSKSAAVDRAEQQKIYLESVLTQLQAAARQRASTGLPPTMNGNSVQTPVAAAQQTLTEMRKKLSDLLVTYTPQYPEVIRQQRLIADQEAEVKRLTAAAASAAAQTSAEAKNGVARELVELDPSAIEMRGRLSATNSELASAKRELASVQRALQQAQSRVNLMPLREQQFAEAAREYDNAKTNYQSLLQKKEQSALATDLVKQWDGQQFREIEPATLPKHHEPPSRTQMVLASWALGFFAGLALAAIREFADRSLRKPEDVENYGHLPVLASIPVLWTPAEQTKRRRRRTLEVATAICLLLVAAGAGLQAFLFA